MNSTETKRPRDTPLEQAIREFGSLVRKHPRVFIDDVEIILLEPYYEANTTDGFKITLIDNLTVDFKKFLKDRARKVDSEGIHFEQVTVFPLNETPVRRVVLSSNRAATMHMQGIDIAVMPYIHMPGENHRGHNWVMSSDYDATMYLQGLKQRIECMADEVSLE